MHQHECADCIPRDGAGGHRRGYGDIAGGRGRPGAATGGRGRPREDTGAMGGHRWATYIGGARKHTHTHRDFATLHRVMLALDNRGVSVCRWLSFVLCVWRTTVHALSMLRQCRPHPRSPPVPSRATLLLALPLSATRLSSSRSLSTLLSRSLRHHTSSSTLRPVFSLLSLHSHLPPPLSLRLLLPPPRSPPRLSLPHSPFLSPAHPGRKMQSGKPGCHMLNILVGATACMTWLTCVSFAA